MKRLGMILAIVMGVQTCPAGAVVAIVLPPPTSSTQCTSNNPSAVQTGTTTCALQGAQASALFNGPSASATVSDPAGVATQNASASLTYYFEVLGGNAGTLVPVLLRTSLHTSAAYPNYASAELDINGVQRAHVCTDGSCTGTSFDGLIAMTVPTLQAEMINVSASAAEGYLTGGYATAFADPYIYVDPSFSDAGRYTILVSPGVSNSVESGVPEPTPWAMAITGLGLIGAALRRRISVHARPARLT